MLGAVVYKTAEASTGDDVYSKLSSSAWVTWSEFNSKAHCVCGVCVCVYYF